MLMARRMWVIRVQRGNSLNCLGGGYVAWVAEGVVAFGSNSTQSSQRRA